MDDGVHELPDNVRTGLSDTKLYLSNTEEVISNAAQIDGCVSRFDDMFFSGSKAIILFFALN
jgi:hypothetical protein